MSNKVGAALASVGDLTDVDALPITNGRPFVYRNIPGSYFQDDAGNLFIYLLGVAATVVGSVVTYGLSAVDRYQTALSTTTARGPVGVAMAAILAGQYGWYQIGGLASALFLTAGVADARVFTTATPGSVDDAVVAGAQIDGAIVSATVAGIGLGSVFLDHPFMNGQGA